jgi:MoxR-like ATPase
MSEEQVSVENQTLPLRRPFMVVATQNPFEFEGTYYLPENQLDRFLLKIAVGYPQRGSERQILLTQPGRTALSELRPVMTADEVVVLQDAVPRVRLEDSLLEYILDLVAATRHDEQLHLGVSPRGGLALTQAAQAAAMVRGRDYVIPDDVKSLFLSCCAHRVVSKTYLHNGDAAATSRMLQAILDRTPAPR